MATSLKIELGTQVVVTERYSRKIGIITKITKTGQFETSITNDTKFNADGSQRGRDLWNTTYCKVATPEDIVEIETKEKVNALVEIVQKATNHPDKIAKLGLDKLTKILAIINEQ